MKKKKLPLECKDPENASITCKLRNLNFPKVMLDLGASVNVLSFSIFKSLNLGPLNKTEIIMQLLGHLIVHPKGLSEDVLVQIGVFTIWIKPNCSILQFRFDYLVHTFRFLD